MMQFSPEFIGKFENQNTMYWQTFKKRKGSYFEIPKFIGRFENQNIMY